MPKGPLSKSDLIQTVFKAKPARKVIKGRPVKATKDAVA